MITRYELGSKLKQLFSPSQDSNPDYTNAYQNSFILGTNQENGLTLRLRDTYDLRKQGKRKAVSVEFPKNIDSFDPEPTLSLVSLLLNRELDSVAAIHYTQIPFSGLVNEGGGNSPNGIFRFNNYWIDLDIRSHSIIEGSIPIEAIDAYRFQRVLPNQYAAKGSIEFESRKYDVLDSIEGAILLKTMLNQLKVPKSFSGWSNTGEDKVGDLRALDINTYSGVASLNQTFGAMSQTDQITWRNKQASRRPHNHF